MHHPEPTERNARRPRGGRAFRLAPRTVAWGGKTYRCVFADAQSEQRVREICTATGDWREEATLVKQNPVRQVYRLEDALGAVFVKRHRRQGWSDRFRDAVRGSPARREFEVSQYALQCQVPAVEVIACAERVDDGQPHIALAVSRAVDHARPLADVVTDATGLPDRSERKRVGDRLAVAVARLLAAAHDAAFLYPDNHAGNVLVRDDAAHEPECLFVDLEGARCGRAVSTDEALRNLAVLDQWFERRATRSERLRCFKAYWTNRNQVLSPDSARRLLQRLVTHRRRHAFTLYRKRDRRIGRRNAYFERKRLPDGADAALTLRVRRVSDPLPLDCDCRTSEGSARLLAECCEPHGEGAANPTARSGPRAETFLASSWWRGYLWRLAGSPGWRRHWTAAAAMNRDLPAARPLACVSCRARGAITAVTWHALRPAGSEPVVRRFARGSAEARRQILEQVGRLLARTGDSGLVLRDIRLDNLAVVEDDSDGPRVFWTGVQGVALSRPAPWHVRCWQLAALVRRAEEWGGLSVVDRSRVVRAICRHARFGRIHGDWRQYWRRIEASVIEG